MQMVVLKRVAKLSNNYALIADEIGQGLYGELDYRHEASNSAEFAMAHKYVPWMNVPKTLSHMTGRKLLIMEWLNGDRPYDLQCVAQGKAYEDGTFPTQEVQQEAKQRLLNMVVIQPLKPRGSISNLYTQFLRASPTCKIISFICLRLKFCLVHVLICDIDDQITKCVFASKGPQDVYMNSNPQYIKNSIKLKSELEELVNSR